MLRFRVKNILPPGGKYFYSVDTEQGSVEFVGYTYDQLDMEVRNYYRANKLDVPNNLRELIEDYICRRVPGSFCLGSDDGKPRAKVVTLQGVRELAQKTVLQYGKSFVQAGTAEQRAHICASCKFNDRTICPTCVGLVKWGERFVGGRKTSYNQYLGLCAKDTLLLPVKVFLARLPVCNEELPDSCWARRA